MRMTIGRVRIGSCDHTAERVRCPNGPQAIAPTLSRFFDCLNIISSWTQGMPTHSKRPFSNNANHMLHATQYYCALYILLKLLIGLNWIPCFDGSVSRINEYPFLSASATNSDEFQSYKFNSYLHMVQTWEWNGDRARKRVKFSFSIFCLEAVQPFTTAALLRLCVQFLHS